MTLMGAVRVAAGSEMNFWTRLEMRGDPTFERRATVRRDGGGGVVVFRQRCRVSHAARELSRETWGKRRSSQYSHATDPHRPEIGSLPVSSLREVWYDMFKCLPSLGAEV